MELTLRVTTFIEHVKKILQFWLRFAGDTSKLLGTVDVFITCRDYRGSRYRQVAKISARLIRNTIAPPTVQGRLSMMGVTWVDIRYAYYVVQQREEYENRDSQKQSYTSCFTIFYIVTSGLQTYFSAWANSSLHYAQSACTLEDETLSSWRNLPLWHYCLSKFIFTFPSFF